MGCRGRRAAPGGLGGGGKPPRSGSPRRTRGKSRRRPGRSSGNRALPPAVTVFGGVLLLALAVFFIFSAARGCVATQEATEVRKYVTGSNSLLTDSSNLGREKLQPLLQQSNGEPGQIDEEAINQVVEQSERLYRQAQENSEVPPEFDEANNYLVSTLGVRATATRQLQRTLSGNTGGSGDALSAAVEDYQTSDSLAQQHYFPASENALEDAGHQEDRNYLEEPRAFMNYRDLGLDEAGAGETGGGPNVLHDLRISGGEVAGRGVRVEYEELMNYNVLAGWVTFGF